MSAYEEGYRAYDCCVDRDDNPCQSGSKEAQDWDNGWFNAASDDEMEDYLDNIQGDFDDD